MTKLKPNKTEMEKISMLYTSSNPSEMLRSIAECTDWASQHRSKSVWFETLNFARSGDLINSLNSVQRAELYYFTSNLWGNALRILDFIPPTSIDKKSLLNSSRDDCLGNQILCLRKALAEDNFEALQVNRKCQIYTNLGIHFRQVGRVIKAFDCWSSALEEDEGFSMAIGNLGLGYLRYGVIQNDRDYTALTALTAKHSYDKLTRALLNPNQLEKGAAEQFEEAMAYIEKSLKGEFLSQPMPDMSASKLMGKGKEKAYRKWCLGKKLFLNVLNDLGPYEAAAEDSLYLRSIVLPVDMGPAYLGFYNQIKQEFIAARYLFYESLLGGRIHYADKNVGLVDTLDSPSYSIRIEKTKMAFRSAYSLLDKIAYFLNKYLGIGYEEHQVSFRGIWKRRGPKGLPLAEYDDIFIETKIYPLMGLLWLSKDIYQAKFEEPIDPEAKILNTVRKHLEHKYFKLYDNEANEAKAEMNDPMNDSLAYPMLKGDFIHRTEEMLKTAREALIYLTFAVAATEKERAGNLPKGKLTPPIYFPRYEENWKR